LKYNVIKKILENIKLDGAKISLFDSGEEELEWDRI
jgi:hypothetical protein